MNWLGRLKTGDNFRVHATNATSTSNVAFVASIHEHLLETTRDADVVDRLTMSWLTRLKTEKHPTEDATNATNDPNVAFVASVLEQVPKTPLIADPCKRPVQDLEEPDFAPWTATLEPRPSTLTVSKRHATSHLLDQTIEVVGLEAEPDRWCWPHSTAMNGRELASFTQRLEQFAGKGLCMEDAEALADKLVQRDRDSDDRRLCMECSHLCGRPSGWRCSTALQADIAIDIKDAPVTGTLVLTLQRCSGFKGVIK